MDQPAAAVLFVDDRPANLDAAAAAGLQTVLMSAAPVASAHRRVASLGELSRLIERDRAG